MLHCYLSSETAFPSMGFCIEIVTEVATFFGPVLLVICKGFQYKDNYPVYNAPCFRCRWNEFGKHCLSPTPPERKHHVRIESRDVHSLLKIMGGGISS